MSDEEKKEEPVRPLSRSEKVRNYLFGVGAVSALILGLLSQFRGEPVAEKTWEVLRANQNKQAKSINRIQKRLVYFQAWQEARTSMEIQAKLDALQEKYDALLSGKEAPALKSPSKAGTTVKAAAPKRKCREGWVRGSDQKCHRVRKAVAAQVKKAVKQVAETKRRLYEEMRKRRAAERKKQTLMSRIKQQAQQTQDTLPALPKRLDDAKKAK